MPLDYFVDSPVHRMVPDKGIQIHPLGTEVHEECAKTIHQHATGITIGAIERTDFYPAAEGCFAVVQCIRGTEALCQFRAQEGCRGAGWEGPQALKQRHEQRGTAGGGA